MSAIPSGRDVTHRGYRLFALRRGPGWRVFIHAPGSALPLAPVPVSDDPAELETVLAEAKAIVDRLIDS